MQYRITDQLDLTEVAALLESGNEVVAQYSQPIYTPECLTQLDNLSQKHGTALQVRFYGHYGSFFDFQTLRHVPHVRNLAADCLLEAINFEALRDLQNLRQLHIGVYNSIPDNLLSYGSLANLESLVLSENKRNRLDLSPIGSLSSLQKLNVTGFTKNLECLGDLALLQGLVLSQIGNRQHLHFINRLSSLASLKIILGGREDLGEVTNPSIEKLEIIRVRGLSTLDPGNFVGLRQLLIEDQIRLGEVSFSRANCNLESIMILNCKTLSSLNGLQELSGLDHIGLFQTEVDLENLITLGLPPQLKSFSFYGRHRKFDAVARKRLDALGYAEKRGG